MGNELKENIKDKGQDLKQAAQPYIDKA